jgi:hypothetical protein
MMVYGSEDISAPFRPLKPFESIFSPLPRPPSKSLVLIYKLHFRLGQVLHQTIFLYKRASLPSYYANYPLTKVTSQFQLVQPHQDTMSNGKNWRSYLAILEDPFYVGGYLSDGKHGTSGRVYFEGLMNDTDTFSPPTREWYKLHLIAVTRKKVQRTEDLWPTTVIAWGLNIWESDLIQMQRSLMQKFAYIRCKTSQDGEPGLTGEEQPVIDLSAYSLVEDAYVRMRFRFPLSPDRLRMDYEWHMAAISQIIMGCWKNSLLALECGYYNKTDGRSTEIGDATWQQLLAKAAKNDHRHGLDAATVSHKRMMEDNEGERSPKRHKLDAVMVSRKRAMEDDEGERSPKRHKTDAVMVSHKRTMEDNEGERSPKRHKLDAVMVSRKRAMEDDEGERSPKRPKTTQYTA